eukprot:GFUD01022724.1.p1 GENE.GFUD01022724.1~~GFUD01022724.1.p1  ORF type:complete len:175 (+),score=43.63 GFUD01022724.1:58-582(+)
MVLLSTEGGQVGDESGGNRARWEDTLRPLPPGVRQRGEQRSRHRSTSPGQQFASTVSSRAKQRDAIRRASMRSRQPSTPTGRSKVIDSSSLLTPRSSSTSKLPSKVSIKPVEHQKISLEISTKYPTEPPIDYPQDDIHGDTKTLNKLRRKRRKSMSSYSSTRSVTHTYPGCLAM